MAEEAERLGSKGGAKQVMAHAFFGAVDWDAVETVRSHFHAWRQSNDSTSQASRVAWKHPHGTRAWQSFLVPKTWSTQLWTKHCLGTFNTDMTATLRPPGAPLASAA